MKCSNCGCEDIQDGFCTNCGCPLSTEPAPLTESDINRAFTFKKIVDIATDKLFFVICILLSVSVGVSLLFDGLDIVNLLIMIFAWIIFTNGRKGIPDPRRVQCISGTVYFIYIMNYVASGLVFLGSCLSAFALNSIDFKEAVSASTLELYGLGDLYSFLEWLWVLPWLIILLGTVFAVICVVLNFFGWQNIHIFIKSVHESASNGIPDYKCCKVARNWLIVFAVINGILAVSTDIVAMLIGAIPVVVQIIGVVIINKHFVKSQSVNAHEY